MTFTQAMRDRTALSSFVGTLDHEDRQKTLFWLKYRKLASRGGPQLDSRGLLELLVLATENRRFGWFSASAPLTTQYIRRARLTPENARRRGRAYAQELGNAANFRLMALELSSLYADLTMELEATWRLSLHVPATEPPELATDEDTMEPCTERSAGALTSLRRLFRRG